MPYRVSIRHVQTFGALTGGWGENYWSEAATDAKVDTATSDLRDALAELKGTQTLLPSARISAVGVNGRQAHNLNFPVNVGSGTTDVASNYPTDALLLKLTTAGGLVNYQWMRGIFDGIVRDGGVYTPTGTTNFLANLKSFFGVLKSSAGAWRLYKLDPTVPRQLVTDINLATGVIKAPAHGLGNPKAIADGRLSGVLNPRGINRVWSCLVIDSDSFQLIGYTPPIDTGLKPAWIKAYIRPQKKVYSAISTCEIVRATSHYTGRPTGLLGGRRRNRRRSRAGTPVDV